MRVSRGFAGGRLDHADVWARIAAALLGFRHVIKPRHLAGDFRRLHHWRILPLLWGGEMLSYSGVLLSGIGAFTGLWIAARR